MFSSKNKKNIRKFSYENYHFTAVKYCSIVHGHVCVMKRTPGSVLIHLPFNMIIAIFRIVEDHHDYNKFPVC